MMCFGRGFPLVGLILLVAATVATLVFAALTTWWVLLALVPLAMMVGLHGGDGHDGSLHGGRSGSWVVVVLCK